MVVRHIIKPVNLSFGFHRRIHKMYSSAERRFKWIKKYLQSTGVQNGCTRSYWVVDTQLGDTYVWSNVFPAVDDPKCTLHVILIDILGGDFGHATVLIVDTVHRTAERFDPDFDPNVEKIEFETDMGLGGGVLDYMGYTGFVYYPAREICMRPQAHLRDRLSKPQDKLYKTVMDYSCQYWTLYYVYRRLSNLDTDPAKLLETIDEHEFLVFVNGVHAVVGPLHEKVSNSVREAGVIVPYNVMRNALPTPGTRYLTSIPGLREFLMFFLPMYPM